MDENKKEFDPVDENDDQNNDNYEYIDARVDDIIEILDPYESEVIEINTKSGGPKKPDTPFMAKIPDAPILDESFNGSSTIILKKGDGKAPKPDDKPKQEQPGQVKPPLSNGPARNQSSSVNPALFKNDKEPAKQSAVNPALFKGSSAPVEPEPEPEKKFKPTPKLIAIAAVAVIVLIFIISKLGGGKSGETINVNEYTKVEFAGLSGKAIALVTIDYDKMASDYSNKVDVKKGNLKDLLQECIQYSLNKSTDLSLDDYVKLSWEINNAKFTSESNGKIKAVQMTNQVTGLEVAVDFDPFSDLLLKYEGNSGEATVSMMGDKIEALPDISFVPSKTASIKNGDEIVVAIKVEGYDDANKYCNEKGFNATAIEKTFTVSGLNEYELYDLFADITVKFVGFDGVGNTEVVKSETAKAGIDFVVEAKAEDKLANGDKVVVKAVGADGKTASEVLAAEELAPKTSEMEFTVEGLMAPTDYSPFDHLKFEYAGISPDGILTLNSDDVAVKNLVFSVDKPIGLANGDKLKVTVDGLNGSDPYENCLRAGYKLTKTEETVEVTGLSHYVSSISEIDATTVGNIDAAARNIMSSVVAGLIDANTISGISYQGYYLQYPKSDDVTLAYNLSFGGNIHNRLFVIYKVDIAGVSGNFSYYWPIEFANLIVLADGTVYVDTSEYIAGLNGFTVSGITYYGYQLLDSFVSSCIDKDSEVYGYQIGQ